MKAVRRLLRRARAGYEKRIVPRCWACDLNRCGLTPKDPACSCCRGNHLL